MEKHAYMIMAHKSDLTFYTLLHMLDDPRNDIFIHMDVKNKDFDTATLETAVHHSGVYLTERTSVTWGGYTQIHVKLLMLEKAQQAGSYAYYHFISGEDLPIQTQDYIHAFFEAHKGQEFVNYESEEFGYEGRVRYYWWLQEWAGRWRTIPQYGLHLLDEASVWLQSKLGVKRNPQVAFQKGETYASITGDFANYIWENREETKHWFLHSLCGDETWFQTLLDNSPYRENLYYPAHDDNPAQIMRLIDWKRGDPYVFRMENWEELEASEMLWARKFDARVDSEIIKKVSQVYGKQD